MQLISCHRNSASYTRLLRFVFVLMLSAWAIGCQARELRLCETTDRRFTVFVTETKEFASATERVLSNSVRADPSGEQDLDDDVKRIMMDAARRNLRLERTDLSSGVTVVAYRLGGRTKFSSITGPANYLMAVSICVNETLYADPSASVPRSIMRPCKWRELEIDAVCMARRDLQALADAMFSRNIADGLYFRIEADVTDAPSHLDTAASDPSRRLVLAPQHQ